MARIGRGLLDYHEENDVEFATQVKAAFDEGIELLHAVAWKSATEGDLVPVYWQGVKVGEIRKINTRLQIELLRAHMPDRFNRGANAPSSIDAPQDPIVTPRILEEIRAARRESLLRQHGRSDDPAIHD